MDDKLEPQGDGCTKSTPNKTHNTPGGDHLEVRVAPLYGFGPCFGLTQANPRLTNG